MDTGFDLTLPLHHKSVTFFKQVRPKKFYINSLELRPVEGP